MKKREIKKQIKKLKNNDGKIIYKCEKCGYENTKTFLNIFEDKEYRYCLRCVRDFYETTYPKAIKKQ